MIVFDLIFGFLLVVAGRNLFWLCVGIFGIGFISGIRAGFLALFKFGNNPIVYRIYLAHFLFPFFLLHIQ